MAHSLRKYLSNRGSALFMVISTMTALMITCMAMYFSVVSARDAEYAVFNDAQSYQSGISIADTILGGLKDAQLSGLMNKMAGMNVGDTMSTNGNDFASLAEGGTKEDVSQLGAYSVDITRLPDETLDGTTKMTYDIATTTSVNGVPSVVHTYIHISKGGGAGTGDSNIFSATGYVPNDAYLDGGYFLTDVFYDTQSSYVGSFGGTAFNVGRNFATGGDLYCNSYLGPVEKDKVDSPDLDKPTTWAIRGNFTNGFTAGISLNPGSNVYVGGDMNLTGNGGNVFSNANIYINGDLNLYEGRSFDDNVNLFVNGDVNIYKVCNVGNLYVNGSVNVKYDHGGWDGYNKNFVKSWNNDAKNDDEDFLSVSEMLKILDSETRTRTYYKWEINDDDSSEPDYYGELDETSSSVNKIKVGVNHTNADYVTDKGRTIPKETYTYVIAYPGSESASTADAVCKAGILVDTCVYVPWDKPAAVIIDTGDSEDNTMVLRLAANVDKDGDGTDETFMWDPTGNSSQTPFGIIVKGKGTVIFDVPEGVTYQEVTKQQTMSYGWFVLLGGIESDIDGQHTYDVSPCNGETEDMEKPLQFIHLVCDGDECDECKGHYTETTSTRKCQKCGGDMTNVYCSEHDGLIGQYCKSCEPEKKDSINCSSHIDKNAVDAYLDSHPDINARMKYKGARIYPHCNIFLVSCEESADMRFASTVDGDDIQKNGFFGFIYAPYMTYRSDLGGANGLRLVGGLLVSDFIINCTYGFIGCYPTKMPEELMGDPDALESLNGFTSQSWKIDLGSY